MLASILLFVFLVVPGLGLCLLAKVNRFILVKGILFSYCVYLLNLGVLSELEIDPTSIVNLYLFEIFSVYVLVWRKNKKNLYYYISQQKSLAFFSNRSIPYVFLIWSILWVGSVGSYLEIPTDVFEHLTNVRETQKTVHYGSLNNVNPWYVLIALCLEITGTPVAEAVDWLTGVAVLIFLSGVVSVTHGIGANRGFGKTTIICAACLSPVFTTLMFGTSVFSYVRYYSFAPAFFAYLFYLLAIGLCDQLIFLRGSKIEKMWIVGVLVSAFYAAYQVHLQEAMFIFTLVASSLVLAPFRTTIWSKWVKPRIWSDFQKMLILAGTGGIVSVLLIGMTMLIREGFGVSHALENNVINMGWLLRSDGNILIGDPLGRSFETIGLGGIATCICFFLFLKKRERSPAISASILIPPLVVFNPFAVYLFLLVGEAEVLWRFFYMTPLGIIAALTIAICVKRSTIRGLVIGGALVLLWTPWMFNQDVSPNRVPTLGRVEADQNPDLWSDLIQQVRLLNRRDILTDPITGYVLGALTQSHYRGFKFHRGGGHLELNKDAYSADSFSGYTGWLLVVNRRDGARSENGAASGHWPPDILKVSRYYSQKLLDFLAEEPAHLALRWEVDNIRLYEIVEPE